MDIITPTSWAGGSQPSGLDLSGTSPVSSRAASKPRVYKKRPKFKSQQGNRQRGKLGRDPVYNSTVEAISCLRGVLDAQVESGRDGGSFAPVVDEEREARIVIQAEEERCSSSMELLISKSQEKLDELIALRVSYHDQITALCSSFPFRELDANRRVQSLTMIKASLFRAFGKQLHLTPVQVEEDFREKYLLAKDSYVIDVRNVIEESDELRLVNAELEGDSYYRHYTGLKIAVGTAVVSALWFKFIGWSAITAVVGGYNLWRFRGPDRHIVDMGRESRKQASQLTTSQKWFLRVFHAGPFRSRKAAEWM